MPKYAYKCKKCEVMYEIVHSMLLKETICKECGEEALMRVASTSFALKKKQKQEQKVGKVVDDFISDARESVKREKKEMQKDFEC